MSLEPPGLTDRVPGTVTPRRAVGRQKLLWLIDGPHSAPDWNASQRGAAVLALRELAATVLTLWVVMVVRFLTPVPGGVVFWAAFAVILVLALRCLYRFASDRPVELHGVIVKVMSLVLAYVVARFGLDPRVAVLAILPGAVAVTAVVGREMATGFAGWMFSVLTAPAAEREAARAAWRAGAVTPETRSVLLGYLLLVWAWLVAVAAVIADGPGLLPAAAFVVAAVSGWCVLGSRGHPPQLVARVVWFKVKLWLSYNPPLTNGRTVREPHLYLMDEPWQFQADRAYALQTAVLAMGLATTSLTGWPPPVGSFGLDTASGGRLVLDVLGQALVATVLPFVLCLAVWFTAFGAALAGYWCRFAAAAVSDAERRSET